MIRIKDLGIAQEDRQKVDTTIKHSGFFITINTNYLPKLPSEASDMSHKLQDFMNWLTSNENLPAIIEFIPPHENDTFNDQTIIDVQGEFRVELGNKKRGGRVHAHFLLKITHRSKIRISRQAIEDAFLFFFRGDPRVSKPHIDIQATSVDANIEAYLKK